ncbi:MAG: hypothetical protein ACREHF_13625 [Rhizomicrobium sp.]
MTREVCMVANASSFVAEGESSLAELGVAAAVARHDDAVLFDWLAEVLSYQGVSNEIASAYMDQHGRISWWDVDRGLNRRGLCPKLNSYWEFAGCGYRKSLHSCAEPLHFEACPLPRHALRNGSLNQSAYSLLLFFRDVADGDFVAWLDRRLADADQAEAPDRAERLAHAVIEPMTNIHGVSYKLLNMALSGLLLSCDPERERWASAGAAMIAVDTLVHNWLVRTGILASLRSSHLYGPACYAETGCASIIRRIAGQIDARDFNPQHPRLFPRFVQYCLWWFCAQDGFDQCNGNRIDDRSRCSLGECPLFQRCRRTPLRPPKQQPA